MGTGGRGWKTRKEEDLRVSRRTKSMKEGRRLGRETEENERKWKMVEEEDIKG